MKQSASVHSPYPESRRWSNRILIISMAAIFLLTLYPFRFVFSAKVSGNWSPFLLDISRKHADIVDAFENILLFVPFGLGLASFLRRRNYSWPAIFSAALLIGAICSYTIEFLQIYIPNRDSGWEDVFTNTSGSLVGTILFKTFGESLHARLARWEQAVEAWCSTNRIAIMILLYFAFWLGFSIWLQHDTHFTNWDASCPIYIGEDAGGRDAWKGRVTLLQIWNRPRRGDVAQLSAASSLNSETDHDLIASYDLTGAPPYQDKKSNLPPLVPFIRLGAAGDPVFQGSSGFTRLTTALPVTGLVRELQKTNQFSLRLDFIPESNDAAEGDIFSVSKSHGVVDLFVWQGGSDLFIHIRSPLASRGTRLRWEIHDIIIPNQPISVLFSYDGSTASIYVNGKKVPDSYYLNPGASIMRRFIHVNSFELPAYSIIYNSLIFLPIGVLLGMAARKVPSPDIRSWSGFVMVVFLPPAILEILLVWVSGRIFSPSLIVLGASLTITGFLLINADRPEPATANSHL